MYFRLEVLCAQCRPQMPVIRLLVLLCVDKGAAAAKSLVIRSGHLSQLLWDGGGTVLTAHLALLSLPTVSDTQIPAGRGRGGLWGHFQLFRVRTRPRAASLNLARSFLTEVTVYFLSLSKSNL